MKKIYFLIMAVMAVALPLKSEVLKSPDGNMVLQFEVRNGVPVYRLDYNDKPVIKDSRLGLELKDADDLLTGFVLKEVQRSTFDET